VGPAGRFIRRAGIAAPTVARDRRPEILERDDHGRRPSVSASSWA